MPQFLALTSRGLGQTLEAELRHLDFKVLKKQSTSVLFESSWKDVYKAHCQLRCATRIIQPILDFKAYNQNDLYYGIHRRHDFTKYITSNQTLAVEAHVSDHQALTDQRFVAQKSKDAIVDQFTEKFGNRPDVDAKNPDLRVIVRIQQSDVSIALDLTGEPMTFRGYRTEAGEAPLREHLAAALVDLSGWTADDALIDPMCGSGTILIEAALKARGGLMPRKSRYLFERWQNFDSAWFAKAQAEVASQAKSISKLKLFGYDKDGKVIARARANAQRAGVEDVIHFEVLPIQKLKAPFSKGVLIANPPYAVRLGEEKKIAKEWEDIAYTLKHEFAGWSCWLLSGNKDVSTALHLKSQRKIPLMNGPMECRFLNYQMR